MSTQPRATIIVFLTALLVLLTLWLPSSSSAASPERTWSAKGPAIAWAAQNAMHHFGRNAPCDGSYAIRWGKPKKVNQIGYAHWYYRRGHRSEERYFSGCVITLNRSRAWDWPKVCTVIAHEMGHLWGKEHGSTRLMNAAYSGAIPSCERAQPTRMPRRLAASRPGPSPVLVADPAWITPR